MRTFTWMPMFALGVSGAGDGVAKESATALELLRGGDVGGGGSAGGAVGRRRGGRGSSDGAQRGSGGGDMAATHTPLPKHTHRAQARMW